MSERVDLLIENAQFLLTSNGSNEIFQRYSMAITDGKISHIGPTGELATLNAAERYDATDKLLLPGLINAHTHLAMSLLRGWAEGLDLQGFLERVWAAEGAIMDEATCELGTELGALEALLAGTTTALDMYLNPMATHRGAVKVGLRHICAPIFFDSAGLDGLQWQERISFANNWPAELEKLGGPFTPIYLSPHSTYTNSPEHLSEIAEIATRLKARIHLHVSETAAENKEVWEKYSKTPTEICRESGLLAHPTIFGHGVHLSDSDLEIVSFTGASIAHCPSSNLKLGSGIANYKKLRASKINVALGTDGCSSSNDLDMFFVMRMAAHLVALNEGPEKVELVEIIRSATIEGARALGMGERIGSLEIGKEADLVAIDLAQPHLTPIHDIQALIVFAAGRGDVTDVWVAGEQVVCARRSTRVDSKELMERANKRIEALGALK